MIGSGLAGTAAALSAGKTGKKVMLLSRDGGASAMSSGALDIAGDVLAVPGRPELWSNQIAKNLEEILLRNPDHPYHLLGNSSEKVLAQIQRAFELVFPSSNGFLAGDFAGNQLVFNQLGTFKTAAFYQDRMLTFDDLRGIDQALVIDFPELRDFDADFFRKNFQYWAGQLAAKTRVSISALDLNSGTGQSSLELARAFEQNPAILEKLTAKLKGVNARLLILPPVLPGKLRREILQRLEQESGIKVRELLAFPPSVPGRRLQEYLEARLNQTGHQQIRGKAVSKKAEGKKLVSVQAKNGMEDTEIFAGAFVLASGSFLAGGLVKSGEFKEELFGLEVFQNSRRAGKIFTEKLTNLKITDPHPVFSVGVKVDSEQRPIGQDGQPAFENLFAAGSILSGANYIFDGTGAGCALATGYQAGSALAK